MIKWIKNRITHDEGVTSTKEKHNKITNTTKTEKLTDTNQKNRIMKYITWRKSDQRYIVKKTVHGKNYLFGYYETKQDAIKVRDWLLKKNWPTELIQQARERDITTAEYIFDCIHEEEDCSRYIEDKGNYYRIQKHLRSKHYVWGSYDDLETAETVRDYLEHCDWPVTLLDNADAQGIERGEYLIQSMRRYYQFIYGE